MRMRPGRRPCADAAALAIMARMNARRVANGEEPNDRAAAREAVRALGLGNAYALAIEDRLRRKFRVAREKLMAAAMQEISPNLTQERIKIPIYGFAHDDYKIDDRAPEECAIGRARGASEA